MKGTHRVPRGVGVGVGGHCCKLASRGESYRAIVQPLEFISNLCISRRIRPVDLSQLV